MALLESFFDAVEAVGVSEDPVRVLALGSKILVEHDSKRLTENLSHDALTRIIEHVLVSALSLNCVPWIEYCVKAIQSATKDGKLSGRAALLLSLVAQHNGNSKDVSGLVDSVLKENPIDRFALTRKLFLGKNASLDVATYMNDDVESWLEASKQAFEGKEFARAAWCAEEAVLLTEGLHAESLLMYAKALLAASRFKEAHHACKIALEISPSSATLLLIAFEACQGGNLSPKEFLERAKSVCDVADAEPSEQRDKLKALVAKLSK